MEKGQKGFAKGHAKLVGSIIKSPEYFAEKRLNMSEDGKRKKVGTAVNGLSPRQLASQEEFLKVREGETQTEWERRTRYRRVLPQEEIDRTVKGRLIKKKNEKAKTNFKVYQKQWDKERTVYNEREHDYLKFYAPIMNWASIKFDIRKEDLEIGFFFYNHPIFTREQFNNMCGMFSRKPNIVFGRFLRNGYIASRKMGKEKKADLHYRLSVEMVAKMRHIYEVMQLEKIPRDIDYKKNSSKRNILQVTLRELQKEVQEIESGKSTADRIIFRNEEE